MRIEAPNQNPPKSSRLQTFAPQSAAPFSRSDIRPDSSRNIAPDRMPRDGVNHVISIYGLPAKEEANCFHSAYHGTMVRNTMGDMPNCIPFSHGRFMFVDIDNGIVKLGLDPATYKTSPSMTLGPEGLLSHGKNMDKEECKLMAAALYVASRNSLTYL